MPNHIIAYHNTKAPFHECGIATDCGMTIICLHVFSKLLSPATGSFVPARSDRYDSSPIAVPAMTDSRLNCEALREQSIQRLAKGDMMDDDLLNYMLGLMQKGAAEQTAATPSQQWFFLNSWFMEKLYP